MPGAVRGGVASHAAGGPLGQAWLSTQRYCVCRAPFGPRGRCGPRRRSTEAWGTCIRVACGVVETCHSIASTCQGGTRCCSSCAAEPGSWVAAGAGCCCCCSAAIRRSACLLIDAAGCTIACAAAGVAVGALEGSTAACAAVGAASGVVLVTVLVLVLVLGSLGSTGGGASSGSKSSCACKGM